MNNAPDTTTYYAIHRAMRVTSTQLHDALWEMVDEDRRRANALAKWFRGFCGELLSHHTIEDEIFFPALQARIPTYDEHAAELEEGHHRLDEIMAALTEALDQLAASGAWRSTRLAALAQAADLRDLLTEHLDIEDRYIVPLFERHFTAKEYERLDMQAKKQGLSFRQALFTVPWLLATCTPEEQQEALVHAPKPLLVIWWLTRRSYARSASYALGAFVGTCDPVAPALVGA